MSEYLVKIVTSHPVYGVLEVGQKLYKRTQIQAAEFIGHIEYKNKNLPILNIQEDVVFFEVGKQTIYQIEVPWNLGEKVFKELENPEEKIFQVELWVKDHVIGNEYNLACFKQRLADLILAFNQSFITYGGVKYDLDFELTDLMTKQVLDPMIKEKSVRIYLPLDKVKDKVSGEILSRALAKYLENHLDKAVDNLPLFKVYQFNSDQERERVIEILQKLRKHYIVFMNNKRLKVGILENDSLDEILSKYRSSYSRKDNIYVFSFLSHVGRLPLVKDLEALGIPHLLCIEGSSYKVKIEL